MFGQVEFRFRITAVAALWLPAIVLAQAVWSTTAAGQSPKYDVIPINKQYIVPELEGSESRAEKTKIRAEITKTKKLISDTNKQIITALRNSSDPSGISGFDTFMKEYVFARMTQTDSQSLSQLGAMRQSFLKNYLSDRVGGSSRQSFIERTTIPEMEKIIDGNYHPAVRLNAVLLMGMLNNREGKSSTDTLPQPSLRALQSLTKVLTDEKYPVVVKVGAMAGIQRHAEVDSHNKTNPRISATDLQQISTHAQAIINGSSSGQDKWPADLSYWLQRRAVQTLGAIGKAGGGGEILDLMLKQLKDEKRAFWLRFDAMVAIGKLDLASVEDSKLPGIAVAIADFASETLAQESKSIKEGVEELVHANLLFEDKDLIKTGSKSGKQRRDGPSMGMGGLEGGGGDSGGGSARGKNSKPQVELPVYQLNNYRQQVKTVVYTAKTTLSTDREKAGLIAIVQPDEKDFIKSVVEVLDRVLSESDKGIVDLDEDDLMEAEDKSVTEQFADILAAGSRDLNDLIRDQKGEDQGGDAFDTAPEESASQAAKTTDSAVGDSGDN